MVVHIRIFNDYRVLEVGTVIYDWLPAWANTHEFAEQLKIPHVDYFGYGTANDVLTIQLPRRVLAD